MTAFNVGDKVLITGPMVLADGSPYTAGDRSELGMVMKDWHDGDYSVEFRHHDRIVIAGSSLTLVSGDGTGSTPAELLIALAEKHEADALVLREAAALVTGVSS